MKRYSYSLQDYINAGQNISLGDLQEIWTQLIKSIELVHNTGHTYNDLKLQNIMLDISETKKL